MPTYTPRSLDASKLLDTQMLNVTGIFLISADAFFKAAISLVTEVPRTIGKNGKLIQIITRYPSTCSSWNSPLYYEVWRRRSGENNSSVFAFVNCDIYTADLTCKASLILGILHIRCIWLYVLG